MKLLKVIAVIGPIFGTLNYAECSDVSKTSSLATSSQLIEYSNNILFDTFFNKKIEKTECIVDAATLNHKLKQNCVQASSLGYNFSVLVDDIYNILKNNDFFNTMKAFWLIDYCNDIINIFDNYFKSLDEKYNNGSNNSVNNKRAEAINIVNNKEFFNFLANEISIFANNIKNILKYKTVIEKGSYKVEDINTVFDKGCETLKEVFDYVNKMIEKNNFISEYYKPKLFSVVQTRFIKYFNEFYFRFFYDKSELKEKFDTCHNNTMKLLNNTLKFSKENNICLTQSLKNSIDYIKDLHKLTEENIKGYNSVFLRIHDITDEQLRFLKAVNRKLFNFSMRITWEEKNIELDKNMSDKNKTDAKKILDTLQTNIDAVHTNIKTHINFVENMQGKIITE